MVKRHPALRDLSSDHHQGLVHARRLKQAAESLLNPAAPPIDAAQAAAEFLTFWDEHTTPHFREEDEVMLPAFSRYGDPTQAPILRMMLEHIQIRRLVDDLRRELTAAEPTIDTMQTLGELFRAHIRYEEDVVFPLIESAMPEPALLELATLLSPAGAHMN